MEGERPTTRHRTAPPLAASHLSRSLFLSPSFPSAATIAARRPSHSAPSIVSRSFPSTWLSLLLSRSRSLPRLSRLFITPTRTYPPLFLALLSRSDVLSAPSFSPSSLVLSPSFSCPSAPLSPSPFPRLSLSLTPSHIFFLVADIRLPLPPTITLRVFLLFAFLPAP